MPPILNTFYGRQQFYMEFMDIQMEHTLTYTPISCFYPLVREKKDKRMCLAVNDIQTNKKSHVLPEIKWKNGRGDHTGDILWRYAELNFSNVFILSHI